MGCHFLLQGLLLTQGSNRHLLYLLHGQVDSLLAEPLEKSLGLPVSVTVKFFSILLATQFVVISILYSSFLSYFSCQENLLLSALPSPATAWLLFSSEQQRDQTILLPNLVLPHVNFSSFLSPNSPPKLSL